MMFMASEDTQQEVAHHDKHYLQNIKLSYQRLVAVVEMQRPILITRRKGCKDVKMYIGTHIRTSMHICGVKLAVYRVVARQRARFTTTVSEQFRAWTILTAQSMLGQLLDTFDGTDGTAGGNISLILNAVVIAYPALHGLIQEDVIDIFHIS